MDRKLRLTKPESDQTPSTKPQSKKTEKSGQILALHANSGRKKQSKGENHNEKLVQMLITRMVSSSRFPGMYNATPTRTVTRRFISGATTAITSLDFQILFGHRQFLVVISAAGTCVCYVDMWRIKSISAWCTSYVDNPTTVDIRPNFQDTDDNCYNDREAVFSITSRSEAEPGHMKIVPARSSPLGSWHKTSTLNASAPLFNINVNNGGASSGNWATSTYDIEFEYVENVVGANPGYSFAGVVTSLGTMGGTNLVSALLLQDINVLN